MDRGERECGQETEENEPATDERGEEFEGGECGQWYKKSQVQNFDIFLVLCDYIDFAVFIDDIDLLIQTIKMVAAAYLDFDNLANAFFAFKQMVNN